MLYVKVFGAERTGALFTGQFIKDNTNDEQITVLLREFGNVNGPPMDKSEIREWVKEHKRPGQKIIRMHNAIQKGELKIIPIIIIKNPYTWYKSICKHRRLRIQNMDWDREYQIYNLLYKVHKDLLKSSNDKYDGVYDKGYLIKYEDLIADPKKTIKIFVKSLKIDRNSEVKIPRNANFNERVRRFYLSKGPWKMSPSDLKRVNDRVDWKLMEYYGYNRVEPEDFYDLVVYEDDEWTFAI